LTRDVSWLLKVNYEDAEALKREYGSLNDPQISDHSLIEIPSAEGRGMREASRRQLNDILEARVEEILEHVYAEVLRVGMERSLLEGAVLTGGGALLPGMCDIAERVLNCQARNGLAVGIDQWPPELDNPVWTTAAGLAMYSGRLRLKREWKRMSSGLAGLVSK
jgi:cell division protein FtsA